MSHNGPHRPVLRQRIELSPPPSTHWGGMMELIIQNCGVRQQLYTATTTHIIHYSHTATHSLQLVYMYILYTVIQPCIPYSWYIYTVCSHTAIHSLQLVSIFYTPIKVWMNDFTLYCHSSLSLRMFSNACVLIPNSHNSFLHSLQLELFFTHSLQPALFLL